MILRIVCSLVLLFAFGVANGIWTPFETLTTGQVAGSQFDNSAFSYLNVEYTLHAFKTARTAVTGITLFLLMLLWISPFKRFLKALEQPMPVVLLAFGALMFLTPTRAWAFAETTDKTEAYTILPNESAFWIPDVGANKDTQSRLESEDYLNANKIAAKRFVIPHSKLVGSGGTSFLSGWDFYVPTGRLIIVDRTPYSREWVAQAHRGTSNKDESFPCQSSEGLDVNAAVSIGASVMEQDAAKYLYRFGVQAPKGDRKDPQVIFTSVYYGRMVSDVMDDVGRKKVQTLVCAEISSRTLDQANLQAPAMMAKIQTDAAAYFAAVGIKLDFIGWADTFTFDPVVQKAINDKYAADKLRDALPVLAAVAQLHVQEGLGKGLENKGLPMVVTPDMINALIGLVKPAPQGPSQ